MTPDAERRAFLRNLKPRIVEIQKSVAENAGFTVTQAELDADIEAAKREYRKQKNEPVGVAIVKITDDNREQLKWLTLAQMLDGKKCIFCGFEWTCRDDVNTHNPIAASKGGDTVACEPCWIEHGGKKNEHHNV